MATPKFNSKSPTIKRILKEAAELANSPSPDYHATPASDTNIFDWHFTLRGPPSTPYSSGIYHGRILLPSTYPLRPPSFRFLTPSGRFEVNREICLSISGHHEETWQPAWGIRTALVALRVHMEGDAKGQLGGVDCSKEERERLAGLSGEWKCAICGVSNSEVLEESERAWREGEGKGRERDEVVQESVPEELRFRDKEELESARAGAGAKKEEELRERDRQEGSEEGTGTDEDAELAEGFVVTGNKGQARPGQGVPLPTGTTSGLSSNPSTVTRRTAQPQAQAPQITAAPRLAQAQAYREPTVAQVLSNEGVPAWVDRSIAVVVACLIAVVLKVLLGF